MQPEVVVHSPVTTPVWAPALAPVMVQGGGFNPISALFNAGEQGIAVPDLTPGNGFLFQDSAGTTPVTAFEQPVGLILDRSKGLTLGSERVTNGAGTDTTGWAAASSFASTLASVSGEFQVTATANFGRQIQAITCVVGTTYKITANARVVSGSNNAVVAITLSDGSGGGNPFQTTTSATFAQLSFYFTATATTHYICMGSGNAATGVTAFTNISVKSIAGNHIIQATSTKRPTLSARYNLLTYSEDFSNAAWVGTGLSSKTATTITASAGGANHYIYQTTSEVHPANSSITFRVRVVFGNTSWAFVGFQESSKNIGVYVKSDGTFGTSVGSVGARSISAAASGGYYVTVTAITTGVTSIIPLLMLAIANGAGLPSFSAAGGENVSFYETDTRLTIDTIGQPAYQRVGASNDYDTAGFFPYLRFDGTDDSMATAASVDFTGTDKMTVFHGVTKFLDSTLVVSELSADFNVSNGTIITFQSYPVGQSKYNVGSKGTTSATASGDISNGPSSNVLTGIANIQAPSVTTKINGVAQAPVTTTQGTGNFGNHTFFLGARNNASLFFNGRLYPFFVRGAATDAGLISQTEQFLKTRMPVSF